MKRFVCIATAAAMICSLAACGGDKKETEAPDATAAEAAEETKAPETDAKAEETTEAGGTTEAGTESTETKAEGESGGKLIMATEAGFAPYEYTEDGATVIGVDVDIANEISAKTPNLCHLAPAGPTYMEDLNEAGGVYAVMKEISKLGLLNLDCMTVTGKTVG